MAFRIFTGTGNVRLSDGYLKISMQPVLVLDFLAGIQLHITSSTSLYMEWMYIDAQSDPVITTTGTLNPNGYEDLFINYGGHRIMLGVMYYVL